MISGNTTPQGVNHTASSPVASASAPSARSPRPQTKRYGSRRPLAMGLFATDPTHCMCFAPREREGPRGA